MPAAPVAACLSALQFDAELRSWLGDSQAEDAELRLQLRWGELLSLHSSWACSCLPTDLACREQCLPAGMLWTS